MAAFSIGVEDRLRYIMFPNYKPIRFTLCIKMIIHIVGLSFTQCPVIVNDAVRNVRRSGHVSNTYKILADLKQVEKIINFRNTMLPPS